MLASVSVDRAKIIVLSMRDTPDENYVNSECERYVRQAGRRLVCAPRGFHVLNIAHDVMLNVNSGHND